MKFLIHGLQQRARALAHMKTPTPFWAPADTVYNDTKSLALSLLHQPEAAPPVYSVCGGCFEEKPPVLEIAAPRPRQGKKN